MALTAPEVFRDYVTDGVPSSGPHDPKKSEIRTLLGQYEQIINAFLSNGGVIYASKAALDADLSKPANTMAWVLGDVTAANNGVYRKVGASGSGSWARAADLPYSFIPASDVGIGTPNIIHAISPLPISGSALVLLSVAETNTGSPVTVSFNGGAPLTVKTNSGNDVVPGGLVAGMLVMGRVSGSTFRLVSDQSSAAFQTLIEGLVAQVEDAAADAIAQGNVPIYSSVSAVESYNVPAGMHAIRINGRTTFDDGEGGLYVDTDNGSADTFTSLDGRTWYRSEPIYSLPAAPALRSTPARFWDKPSVRDWSALGNDVDDTSEIRAAATYCENNQKPLYFPAGNYAIAGTIDLTKGFPIVGDGPLVSRVIPRNFNGTAFRYVTDGESLDYFTMRDLEIVFDFPDTEAEHALSTGIEFGGDDNFIQEGTFENILIRGPRSAFRSSKPSHTTIFGEEGTVAWITYKNVQVADYQRQVDVAWNFPLGSGTGNLWESVRTRMGKADGYIWRFEGDGCVIGDILISDSNLLGPANGFLGEANTVYRRNIRITGCQFDASIINPIVFSPVGSVAWNDYDIANNNFGGGTTLANLPLSHGARYTGNEVGRLEDGKRVAIEATGAQTQPAFRVSLDQYSGCVIEFSVAGIVGGVGGGVARIVAIADRQTGTPTVVGIDQTRTPNIAGYPDLYVTTNASGYVEFGFTCTPSSANTRLNAQVLVRNGTAKITQV